MAFFRKNLAVMDSKVCFFCIWYIIKVLSHFSNREKFCYRGHELGSKSFSWDFSKKLSRSWTEKSIFVPLKFCLIFWPWVVLLSRSWTKKSLVHFRFNVISLYVKKKALWFYYIFYGFHIWNDLIFISFCQKKGKKEKKNHSVVILDTSLQVPWENIDFSC